MGLIIDIIIVSVLIGMEKAFVSIIIIVIGVLSWCIVGRVYEVFIWISVLVIESIMVLLLGTGRIGEAVASLFC